MSVTHVDHERVLELLPWFVNGTLDADDRTLVEQHIRSCLHCRGELKAQRALHTALQGTPPALREPAELGFRALVDRIDRGNHGAIDRRRRDAIDGRIQGGPLPDHGSHAAAYRRRSPHTRARLAAALAAVIVLLVGGAWLLYSIGRPPGNDAAYATLGHGPAADQRIDVIFTAGTTDIEIRALLGELDAAIVSGPSELGRYTLSSSRIDSNESTLDELIERLQHDERVRFAARSFLPPEEPGADQ